MHPGGLQDIVGSTFDLNQREPHNFFINKLVSALKRSDGKDLESILGRQTLPIKSRLGTSRSFSVKRLYPEFRKHPACQTHLNLRRNWLPRALSNASSLLTQTSFPPTCLKHVGFGSGKLDQLKSRHSTPQSTVPGRHSACLRRPRNCTANNQFVSNGKQADRGIDRR